MFRPRRRPIGYRVAIHREDSAARIAGKIRSARKWSVYCAMLIKRFGLQQKPIEGYPSATWLEPDRNSLAELCPVSSEPEQRS